MLYARRCIVVLHCILKRIAMQYNTTTNSCCNITTVRKPARDGASSFLGVLCCIGCCIVTTRNLCNTFSGYAEPLPEVLLVIDHLSICTIGIPSRILRIVQISQSFIELVNKYLTGYTSMCYNGITKENRTADGLSEGSKGSGLRNRSFGN
jgi:hypothetical protein